MRVTTKAYLAFLGICIAFLFSGVFLIVQTENMTKVTIANNYQVRAKILANSVDHIIHEKISSFERFHEKQAIHPMKSSNEEFSQFADVHEYIKQIDSTWNSQSSVHAEAIIRNDFSNVLADQASYYNKAWDFNTVNENTLFIKEIIMTNSYGATIAATNKPSDYRQDDEKWWNEARNMGYYVDDIYYDESSKTNAIAISLAINDDQGNFVGVAKYVLDPLAISYPLQEAISVSKYNTTKYYLLTNDGKTIYSNYFNVGRNVLSESFFGKIINSEGHIDSKLPDGTEILFVYAKTADLVKSPSLNWIVGISIDNTEIIEQIIPLINQTCISLVIIFVSVSVIVFTISRTNHNKLAQIRKIANQISNGNLDEVSQLKGNDEFAEISGYFDRIRRSLKCQLETIRQNEYQIKGHLDHVKRLIQQKDEFISLMAHELKTPLVPILGHIELLKEISTYDNDQLESMDEITKNANRIESLVNDLLDAQKLDCGKMKIHETKFKVTSLLFDAYHEFVALAKKKNIQFEIKDDTNDVSIESDFQRLSQVLRNLLLNSFDFVKPDGGKILLTALLHGDNVVISVIDNGIGISKENHSKLFTKFYQIDSTIKRSHGGTGLGLVICKGIMELLDGTVKITSEKNLGTTVSITLPLRQKKTTDDSKSKPTLQLSEK